MIILRQKGFATGVERTMMAKNKIHPIPTPNRTAIRQLDHLIPYKKAELSNKLSTLPQRFMSGYYEGRRKFVPKSKESKLLEKIALNNKMANEETKSKKQLLRDIATSKENAKLKKLERNSALAGGRESTTQYIGKKIVDAVNMTAENPITSAGMLFGYGSTPIQVAAGQYWGPIGTASLATEQTIKRGFPGYKRGTEKLARLVKKKHIGEKVAAVGQGVLNSIPL